MTTHSFVQGTTAPQDFQLMTVDATGAETPFDGTASGGFTVTLVLTSHATGVAVDTTGDVSWLNAALGTVRYSPDSADLTAAASPYDARWKVTDLGGLVAYFPDAIPDRWIVRL